MGPITLLLGKTRSRRIRAMLREMLADLDPSHLLWVTDTGQRDRIEAAVLEALPAEAAFAPELASLSDLLGGLWRQVDDRPWMNSRASAVIAEQIARGEEGSGLEWLRRLGSPPLVGGALDRVFGQWVEAGRPALEGWGRAAGLREALRAYERRLSRSSEAVHPALALERLRSRLTDARVPGGWLVRQRVVIVDELMQPSPLRRAILIDTVRLWAAAGVKVILTFESGRDLGGQEAGLFFEYDDLSTLYALRPFAATRPLRRDLFAALIPTGEADILVAGPDRSLLVDPLNEAAPAEPPDLSDRMYGRDPLPAPDREAALALLGGAVTVAECPDPESELRAIARSVKRALLEGAAPGDCAVALAGLVDYAPLLRAVFRDYGVPAQLSSAMPLGRTPGARLMRELPRLALDGFPCERLLPLMDSRLMALPEGLDAAALLRWCRAAGLRDEPPRRWRKPLTTWMRRTQQAAPSDLDEALHVVQAFCDRLAPLARADTPEGWRDALMGALEALEVPARLGRCPEDPSLAFENLRAWGAAVSALDELVRELTRFDPGTWDAERLAAHLERTLDESTWRPDPRSGGVRVVDALELGGPAPRTWLGGLSRGAFLRHHRSASFLLPRWVERGLEGVDPVAEARFRFGSLLRNALADPGITSLSLSWPAVRDGRSTPPSPVLQELLSLPTTHPDGLLFGDLVVRSLDRDEGAPASRSDALRAAAANPAGWSPLLGSGDLDLLSAHRELYASRTAPTFGPYDGVLSRPPSPPEALAVTALESYLRCPARYWYRRVLGLRSPTVWDPELAPDRRGTAFHRILQEFVERRDMAPVRADEDLDAAAALLHRIGGAVLDEVSEEGGVDPTLLAHLREVWLSGLVDGKPAGTLKVWLDREAEEELGLEPEAVEKEMDPLILGGVILRGTLDRLDRLVGPGGETVGLLVTDYKTGYAPSADLVRRGLALQPVAYAEFAIQAYGEQPVASVYYVLRRPDELERRSWCGDAEVLEALVDRRRLRYTLPMDRLGRRRLMDHAAEGVRRLMDGRFHPTLADPAEAGCAYCEYRRVCRLDLARAPGIEGDWQRPLVEEAP